MAYLRRSPAMEDIVLPGAVVVVISVGDVSEAIEVAALLCGHI